MSKIRRITKNTRYARKILKRKALLQEKLKSGKKVGVTWVAQKGETKASISLKNWTRKGKNTTAHIKKFLTAWCVNRQRWVNINLLALKQVRAEGQEFSF